MSAATVRFPRNFNCANLPRVGFCFWLEYVPATLSLSFDLFVAQLADGQLSFFVKRKVMFVPKIEPFAKMKKEMQRVHEVSRVALFVPHKAFSRCCFCLVGG